MTHRRGDIRIGISGWTYAPWRGVFYPKGLSQRRELAYAAQRFGAIEINGTFYGLQKPDAFARWRDETPEGFVFALKGSRYITHMRRLRDVETPLANFLASGLLRLGPKLGPILWQFPPRQAFDAERMDSFLRLLPRSTGEAACLARRHDARVEGRQWTESEGDMPLRHAVEIRHDSFRAPEFIALLRQHQVALVCADTVEWPRLMDMTADFAYVRLHGSTKLYESGYSPAALKKWAERIQNWASGGEAEGEHAGPPGAHPPKTRDVYVFFDNDIKVKAPANAAALQRRLGIRDAT
ncbi:DUF72 domain-containing protein [Roseococcus sp. YIM B11640]|uniref:DUF72 domain-containing protein n=1 Tax=Roseococcus sp. YIM B11640 TaxID=3133973 RepID=UPI003C7D62C1